MTAAEPASDAELVAELRTLRRLGLPKLRASLDRFPGLRQAASEVYGNASATEVESLVTDAWRQLGNGPHGQTIGTLFGLAQGRRGAAPSTLRQAAARQAGYATVETFRKAPENRAIEDLAHQVISIRAQRRVRTGESDDRVASIVRAVESLTSLELAELARQLATRLGPLPPRT